MPEQTIDAPKAQRFMCPGCAAAMQFDPDSGKIKCPFCGQMLDPPPGSEIVSHDYLEALKGIANHAPISEQAMEVQCAHRGPAQSRRSHDRPGRRSARAHLEAQSAGPGAAVAAVPLVRAQRS